MNSLNILTGRASSTHNSNVSRTDSFGDALVSAVATEGECDSRGGSMGEIKQDRVFNGLVDTSRHENDVPEPDVQTSFPVNEKVLDSEEKIAGWYDFPKRIYTVLAESLRWLLSTVASPSMFLVSLLYDNEGTFLPFSVFYKSTTTPPSKLVAQHHSNAQSDGSGRISRKGSSHRRMSSREGRPMSSNSSSSGMSSDSEYERDVHQSNKVTRAIRARTFQKPNEISPARRSIRIKLHNEDSLRQRSHRNTQFPSNSGSSAEAAGEITPATLKSPTSPTSSLSMTKYPRTPAPPRPLVPRRQPSFTIHENLNGRGGQKTLVLDLDETLIHSMAKGGRMGSGHMVEVKLNTVIGTGSGTAPGPQHPILYYVHKRPHCDEFLRKICKWYNLVIFTASVQEYADPVIDWLEQERKFFSGRFYRQHCTYRHNAFIKDLSSVQPDLSKVMILDNSPLSYMFHQDNAIPIEGWINDPSDNDLLHLVPLLEGLQHVTDVRAFLALRGGEDGKHV